MVKPSFFKHADLYDAEVSSGLPLRIAFEGLWTVADRRGVFAWSRNIKPDVIPYDPVDMLQVLDALALAGFVTRYEVDGKPYGIIPTLGEHQHFHKDERASALPAPPEHHASNGLAPGEQDADTMENGRHTASGIRHTKSGITTLAQKAAPADADFEEAWQHYPRRSGGNSKAKALKAWRSRRRAGVKPDVLTGGLLRYKAFVKATGKENTEYVMQAATFFGPDEHYLEQWTVPAVVIAPPRRPFVSVTEEANRRDAEEDKLAAQYSEERRKFGARWAKEHPGEYEPILAVVDLNYRGIPPEFCATARRIELTSRCGDAAGFPTFEEWRAAQETPA